ncbi:MAG TPA: hypothetical protein VGR29_02780 [Thermomicrobiales bacterium]|nr:hypothetical protein [Thermomicrobiales bacterium]
MPFTSTRRSSFLSMLILSATLTLSTAAPVLAQDGSTPVPGSEISSETTSQLPAADLPTMNQQGFVFELESTYDGAFTQLPEEAPVYTMRFPQVDAERAKTLAGNLGIDGEVETEDNATFDVQDESGSLFIVPGMMQFISFAEIPQGDLPTDEQGIAFAREWLRQVNLLPADVGEGKVVTRIEDPPRIIVSFQPITPSPLLSATPNITVTLGPEGAVLESSYRWADISQSDLYQLRGTSAAWTEVESQRSYLETLLPSDQYEPGAMITGVATYDQVSLAYTSSGIPGEQQYLQPVYVFSGQVTPEGSDTSYPITSYVPALINSQQPVG